MQRLLLILLTLLSARGADFYVSPRGDDARDGRAESNAWRSLARVNRYLSENGLQPGDHIRLRGGATFEGNLVLAHAHGGTESQPVLITTYGKGRATLLPAKHTGILIRETPWVVVSNLNLVAGPNNQGDGIRCDRNRETNERIPGIEIHNCSAVGFGWHGIMIDAAQRPRGFERVRVSGCLTQSNRYAGIMVYGGNPAGRTERPHHRIVIEACTAIGNPGDPDQRQYHSGSGILLDGVDTGRIRGCVATENGRECRNDRGGPVGIWAHASRRVVIERCESFSNRSGLRDGGGFDLDGGCEECVLRGNFAHDNHGPGFLVYTYTGAGYADRDCRVVENVSWNDGARSAGYAGIQIGAEDGCRITGLELSRNTVVAGPGSVAALRVMGESVEAGVRNNLLVATEHGILVAISGLHHRLQFARNQYWREDGQPVFLIDSQWTIPSLSSWRNAEGPDFRFTEEDEIVADPRLPRVGAWPKQRSDSAPRWPNWSPGSLGMEPGLGAPTKPPALSIDEP